MADEGVREARMMITIDGKIEGKIKDSSACVSVRQLKVQAEVSGNRLGEGDRSPGSDQSELASALWLARFTAYQGCS